MDGKYREDQSANKAHLEQRLGKVIRDFDDDFDKVLASKASEIQFSFKHLNIDNELPFYLFSNDGELIYWSAIDMIPDFNNFSTAKSYQLLENNRGIYFTKLRKIVHNHKDYWLLHVYPFYDKVEIGNEYLKSGFNPEIFGNDRFLLSGNPKENYQNLYFEDHYLFSVFLGLGMMFKEDQ